MNQYITKKKLKQNKIVSWKKFPSEITRSQRILKKKKSAKVFSLIASRRILFVSFLSFWLSSKSFRSLTLAQSKTPIDFGSIPNRFHFILSLSLGCRKSRVSYIFPLLSNARIPPPSPNGACFATLSCPKVDETIYFCTKRND